MISIFLIIFGFLSVFGTKMYAQYVLENDQTLRDADNLDDIDDWLLKKTVFTKRFTQFVFASIFYYICGFSYAMYLGNYYFAGAFLAILVNVFTGLGISSEKFNRLVTSLFSGYLLYFLVF